MENFSPQLLIPAGAVTAALIAGFFSFLNLVISKEQKISEFRQTWIDTLRDDLCRYIAAVRYLSSANQAWEECGGTDVLKHFESMRSTVDTASQAYASIVLKINPDDSDRRANQLNASFLAALETVRKNVDQDKYDEARSAAATLTEKMQPILKREWSRVKTGEPIYRITRTAALLMISISLATGAWYVYRAHIDSRAPTGELTG